MQELNAVYNLTTEKDIGTQPHLIQNIINESYNHNYLYDQQLPPHLPLHQHQHLPPHLPLHQLDTHQLSHPEESTEPIYQNQGQILAQQQEREGEEPIYQNLPLHEKLNLPVGETEENLGESEESDTGSIHIDDTIDGVPLGEGGIRIEKANFREEFSHVKDLENSGIVRPNIVSRIGLTNSREDVSVSEQIGTSFHKKSPIRTSESPEKGKIFSEGEVLYSARSGNRSNEPRKKLEMRQYLEPAVQNNIRSLDESLINTVNSSSLSLARVSNDSFDKISNFPSDLNSSETLRKKSVSSVGSEETLSSTQGRSKGRKRWGLNMAVKSGSLKSNKSEKSDGGSKSGDDSRHSSGRGMGAMMLANLHGERLVYIESFDFYD